MTLDELKKALEEAQELLDTRRKQMEKALADDPNADEVKAATSAFNAAEEKFNTAAEALEKGITAAKQKQKAAALLTEAGELSKTIVPAGAALAGEVDTVDGGAPKDDNAAPSAQPVDIEKDLRIKEGLFFDFCRDKALSDRQVEAVQPNNHQLKKEIKNPTKSAVIPTGLWSKMLGMPDRTPTPLSQYEAMAAFLAKAMAQGIPLEKAIPMLSGDALADGGRSFLHWPDYDNVLRQLPPENPNFFDRVTKKMVTGSELKEPVLDQSDGIDGEYGGVVVSRGTEGSDANETEIDIKQVTITCYPMNAYTEMSWILLHRDRVGIEAEIVGKFRPALYRRLNYEILHGTGSTGSECLGIRQSDDVETVARQTASDVCFEDLVNLEHTLRPAVRANAGFALADTVLKALKLKTVSNDGTTDQRPLFSATTGSGPHNRLDNYPYFTGTDQSSLGSAGDVIFGAWLLYWLAIEQEAVMSQSDDYKFKKALRAYRIDTLVGGRPLHPEAFVVLSAPSSS